MKPGVIFFLVFFLLLPVCVTAEIPPAIRTDFETASGYIIMPISDEFLVDLDAASNLQEGDILTLVMPGEKVVHPITKEVLGTLDIPTGYLQVTRLKSGYSYAKLLFSEVPPEKGHQVKRFEHVPTRFEGTGPAADQLLAELKSALPQLNWLDESSSTEPLLTFSLQKQQLLVKNVNGASLRNYPYVGGELRATRTNRPQPVPFKVDPDPAKNKGFLNKTVNNLIDSIGLGSKNQDPYSQAGITRTAGSSDTVWMSPNLEGAPVGVIVTDINNDNIKETVVALATKIIITQIQQGNMAQIGTIDIPPSLSPLRLDAVDLDKNGTTELYLTAARGEVLASLGVEFDGSDFVIFSDSRPWFFRVVDLPGEGPTLLGQTIEKSDTPFYGNPFRITRSGNKLEKGEEVPLPPRTTLNSVAYFPGTDGKQLIARIDSDDYLHVSTSQGLGLWESNDYFGGTEELFYYRNRNTEIEFPIYVQKRIIHSPDGELIVAQNEGLRTLQRYRRFNNSRVVAFNWNGFALQESWRTNSLNGYLADFSLADADNDGTDELVLALKFKHGSALNKARSAVVIYELN